MSYIFYFILVGVALFGLTFLALGVKFIKNHKAMAMLPAARKTPNPEWAVIVVGVVLGLAGLAITVGSLTLAVLNNSLLVVLGQTGAEVIYNVLSTGFIVILAYLVVSAFYKAMLVKKEADPMVKMEYQIAFVNAIAFLALGGMLFSFILG